MPLGMEVGLRPGHIVLDGDPASSPQRGTAPPIFSPCLLWPNGWMHQDATWYGGRPQPSGLCVRWGPRPQFSAHVYCGQAAAWIKMPLGTEVRLGPEDIVLDGDPASSSPKSGRNPCPIFSPCLLWPNGWMDQDATWCEGRPRPRPHCVTWDPAHFPSPPRGAQLPKFSADVYCGQTVARLSYC